MVSACMRLKCAKTMRLQHEVQCHGSSRTEEIVGGIGGRVKVAFVELDEAFRWIIGSHGSGFEDFMIKRHGEFFLGKSET